MFPFTKQNLLAIFLNMVGASPVTYKFVRSMKAFQMSSNNTFKADNVNQNMSIDPTRCSFFKDLFLLQITQILTQRIPFHMNFAVLHNLCLIKTDS